LSLLDDIEGSTPDQCTNILESLNLLIFAAEQRRCRTGKTIRFFERDVAPIICPDRRDPSIVAGDRVCEVETRIIFEEVMVLERKGITKFDYGWRRCGNVCCWRCQKVTGSRLHFSKHS